MGHHSAAFTLSVYVHLLDGDLGDPLDVGLTVPGADAEVLAADTREAEPAVEVRPHLTLVESA